MTTQYIYFVIFAFLAYLIITDRSVAQAFLLVIRLMRQKLQIFKWWIINDPSTPWTRFIIWRRSLKMAEELMKEFEEKNK